MRRKMADGSHLALMTLRPLAAFLAAAGAFAFLLAAAPIRPHPAPQAVMTRGARLHAGIVLSRLDQTSRSVRIAGLRPGLRTELYANGFLVASGVARAAAVSFPIRRRLSPGSRVVVVQRTPAGLLAGKAESTVLTDVTTYHFDNARDGWNPYEQTLAVANVTAARFGLRFNLALDGDTMGEPLYVGDVFTPVDGNTHDIIYAATENDSLFAFDADTGAPIWQQSYLNAANGDQPVPISDLSNCRDIQPNVGITSTPVIDTTTNTLFLVTKVVDPSPTRAWHQYLHAVDIGTGLDLPGSPLEIQGSITTPGGQTVTFDPRWQLNRAGLLLANGAVYVSFASHCDFEGIRARGWMFAYDENTLQPLAASVTTVDDLEGFGGIWQSGFAPAADDFGNVYFVTGNGMFDGTENFGDSVMKTSPALALEDSFTPADEADLDDVDADFGSGGAMLLPMQAGPVAELLVAAGKDRTLYLLNRNALGGFTPGGPDNVVQEIQGAVGVPHGIWGGPAMYEDPNGQLDVYYCGGQDQIKGWALTNVPSTMLVMTQATKRSFNGLGGTTPVVSSNGEAFGTGIVWAIQRPANTNPAVRLFAFDAMKLSHQLISLPVGTYDHNKGSYFGVPTVVNGRVYVGYGSGIAVFGELQ